MKRLLSIMARLRVRFFAPRVRVLQVAEGDIIVLTVDRPISESTRLHIQAAWRQVFRGHEVAVLDAGMDVMVVRGIFARHGLNLAV